MSYGSVAYIRRKPKHTGKLFFILSLILLAGILGIAILSVIAGWKVLHPAKKEVMAFHSNIVPTHKNIIFYDIDYKRQLNGWLFDVPDSRKTIIMAHDYGANRLQFGEKTINLIKGLQTGGFDVFIFDFGNSGDSQGDISTFGYLENKDMKGAVRYIKTAEGPVEKLVLLGFGTGAVSSICTAGEDLSIDAVVADSPFNDLKEFWLSNLHKYTGLPYPFNYTVSLALDKIYGVVRASVSPKKSLNNIPQTPLLLIHQTNDPVISVRSSRELAIINPRNEFWEIKGDKHSEAYSVNPEEYVNKILDFLKKKLRN